jgi:hypothetical protein
MSKNEFVGEAIANSPLIHAFGEAAISIVKSTEHEYAQVQYNII